MNIYLYFNTFDIMKLRINSNEYKNYIILRIKSHFIKYEIY